MWLTDGSRGRWAQSIFVEEWRKKKARADSIPLITLADKVKAKGTSVLTVRVVVPARLLSAVLITAGLCLCRRRDQTTQQLHPERRLEPARQVFVVGAEV